MKKTTRNTIITAIAAAIVGVVVMIVAQSTTLYVSLAGNDQNTGALESQFRTISHCENVAGFGDTCNVAAGTYNEIVRVDRSNITFTGTGKVVVKGFKVTANDVTIDKFFVEGEFVGIDLDNANNSILKNLDICSSHPESSGINTNNVDGLIGRDIWIHKCDTSLTSYGWAISGNAINAHLIEVLATDCGGPGGEGKHCFYLDNWKTSTFVKVECRRSWNSCFKIIGVDSFGVSFDGVIAKNIGESGVYGSVFMICDGRPCNVHDVEIKNSTVTNSLEGAVIIYGAPNSVRNLTIHGKFYPIGIDLFTLPLDISTTPTPTGSTSPTVTATFSQTPSSSTPSKTLTHTQITPTQTRTATKSATPTRTPTPVIIPSATRTATSTPMITPSSRICARITWLLGVSIRPSQSLSNISLGPGYSYNRIVPIEAIETVGDDQWARINYGQWFAMKIGTRTYAKTSVCP